MPLEAKSISEIEAYAHLKTAYNPPTVSDTSSPDAFYAEWHSVQQQLLNLLAPLGVNNAYGQGDYYVAESATLSRGINVAITSQKSLTTCLVPRIQTWLLSLDYSYEINLTVSTKEGDFEVFVSKDKVSAWVPIWVADQLGLTLKTSKN